MVRAAVPVSGFCALDHVFFSLDLVFFALDLVFCGVFRAGGACMVMSAKGSMTSGVTERFFALMSSSTGQDSWWCCVSLLLSVEEAAAAAVGTNCF